MPCKHLFTHASVMACINDDSTPHHALLGSMLMCSSETAQAVRADYGANPYILNLVGPMLAGAVLNTTQQLLQGVVSNFTAAGDANMGLYTFPYNGATNMQGCGGHPNAAAHASMATQLQPVIEQALGWSAVDTRSSINSPATGSMNLAGR